MVSLSLAVGDDEFTKYVNFHETKFTIHHTEVDYVLQGRFNEGFLNLFIPQGVLW